MLKWTKYGNGNELERKRRELVEIEKQKNSQEFVINLKDGGGGDNREKGINCNKKIIKSYSIQNISEIKTVKEKGRRNAIKKFKNGKERKLKFFANFINFGEEFLTDL